MYRMIQNFLVIFVLSVFINGCGSSTDKNKQEENTQDKIPPKITLIGEKSLTQIVDSTYKELGATALDNRDGDITSEIEIVGFVDTSKEGNYSVSYSVSDSAENKAEVKRRISIIKVDGPDRVKPIITLKGLSTILLPIDGTYEEKNATALDDRDGDITSKIEIVSFVDTSKEGSYSVSYSVSDSEGNTAVKKRTVEIIKEPSVDDWVGIGPNRKTTLVDDDEQNIKVLSLDSNDSIQPIFVYRKSFENESKYIKWSFKTKEIFSLRIEIETNNGNRTLFYNEKDTGAGESTFDSGNGNFITHGIGSNSTDGEWHSYTRDIERDLKRYEPTNQLKKINAIFFYGTAKFAQMKLYSSEEDVNINKPVEVSAPGIILTFDDSYVDNWNNFMAEFKKNDVVATFFCHRWGSTSNITESEEATLKLFESDGHEIGYHTKDHLGTKDEKYSINNTIEEKARAYFDDQITPGLDDMIKRGFAPKSFSYPYISGQPAHNELIREELPHIREFFAHVMLIDENVEGSRTIEEIKTLLDKLKADKEIGVLLGHWIAEASNPSNVTHQVRDDRLKQIIAYAKEIGLKFYTLEEAHKFYVNQ